MDDGFVYLDNASATWPKPEKVYEKANETLRECSVTPRKESYRMSERAIQIVMRTGENAAGFFDMSSRRQIVFTHSREDALRRIMDGLIRTDSRVVAGPYETDLLYELLEDKVKSSLKIVKSDGHLGWDLEDLHRKCSDGVDYLFGSYVCGITGCRAPVKEIASIVHNAGGFFITDATYGAGILPISMENEQIDVLYTAADTGLYGIPGAGLLLIELSEDQKEWKSTHRELPGIAALAALDAGISFVKRNGVKKIAEYQQKLADCCIEQIMKYHDVKIFGRRPAETGIFSFSIQNENIDIVRLQLETDYYIGIGAGLQGFSRAYHNVKAPKDGAIRVSFSCFNTREDSQNLADAVRELAMH